MRTIKIDIKDGYIRATYNGPRNYFDMYTAACRSSGLGYVKSAAGWVSTIHNLPRLVEAVQQQNMYLVLVDDALFQLGEACTEIENVESMTRLICEEHGLYPYQCDGVQFLIDNPRALLIDDMGLGKTVQALMAIPKGASVMVICPSIVKGAWAQEVAKWRPDLKAAIIKGTKNYRQPEPDEVVIANYELLPPKATFGCDFVIADEAHYAKTYKAQRTRAFRSLARKAGHVWGLSGTPLENKPNELWGVLQSLQLGNTAFGSWQRFLGLHGGIRSEFGIEWTGAVDKEASRCLSRVALRRTKASVLPELPTKRYRQIRVDVSTKTHELCSKAMTDAGDEINIYLDMDIQSMSIARRELAEQKIPYLKRLISEYEENEEPVVVFSAHRAPIDVLASRDGWAVITGDVDEAERTRVVADFQAGKLRGVACTIQAGGVGITLTRAAHMIFRRQSMEPG